MRNRKEFYLDLLERALWTFVQGFAAAWLVTSELTTAALMVGVVGGLISVAKSIVAKGVGDKESASTLPKSKDS